MISRTKGSIDDLFIGRYTSTEGLEGKGSKSTAVTGVDMSELSFAANQLHKEAYKKYIKNYMKSIKGKVEEKDQKE